MMKELLRAIKIFFVFSIMLGLAYPLLITLIAQAVMKEKADGSLIKKNNIIIGSKLIAQGFTQPKYFHPRPSSCNYDPLNIQTPPWGPINSDYIKLISDRIQKIKKENLLENILVPADMVLDSSCGLDPYISIHNARIQGYRIAAARNIDYKIISNLINKQINNVRLYFLLIGNPCINVLKINLALDKI